MPRPVPASLTGRGVSESSPSYTSVSTSLVAKDRRVTSPGMLESIDDDDDADDYLSQILNRPSDEIVPRPVSAYVDFQQSYAPVGSRDSRDMSLHENPMQSRSYPSPIHREKAQTVHTTKLDGAPMKQIQRRPSPTDMKNLDDFKKGRSSKRAAGKTQL